MNMFLWLLDFVTPSNIFLKVLVFWYIIIQLSLSGSVIVYYLIIAN